MRTVIKTILDKEEFSFEGEKYIARRYILEGKSAIYGEIVYKDTGMQPYGKMKSIARGYLAPYGIEIPTSANHINTHIAVGLLIDCIRKHKK